MPSRIVVIVVIVLSLFIPAAARAQSLPSGWSTSDIGAVGAAGSATASGGTFTVAGAGADIWNAADAFRFVYTTLTGDGSIVAKVASVRAKDSPSSGASTPAASRRARRVASAQRPISSS
jgi:hypothetical protein